MTVSLFLSVNREKDKAMSVKWFIYSFLSFSFWGLIGICQQLHQNSAYAGEINEFLLWSFVYMTIFFSVIYFAVGNRQKEADGYSLKSRATLPVILSGLLIAVVYKINLYLAGKMPGAVFFPIVSGGVLLLSSIMAMVFFKEKLSAKQKVGIVAGIVAVCLLGI